MKINIQLGIKDFIKQDEYGHEVSFEECIIQKLIKELSNKISCSQYWKDTYIINRLLDNILKESNGIIKEKFENAIENKINRSNFTSKINKKLSNITEEKIQNNIINNINFEKIIRNEVKKTIEEKFK